VPTLVKARPHFFEAVSGGSATTLSARSDRSGRLTINVPLGPADSAQQYTAAAAVTGAQVYLTTVTIAGPGIR
jgi:hypothetical protein